jgi:hypothetical protein
MPISPDWFTAPAHLVPREPGRPGTVISNVCAYAGKWPQNNLFASTHAATVLAYRQPNRRSTKLNARDDSGWNGAGNQ